MDIHNNGLNPRKMLEGSYEAIDNDKKYIYLFHGEEFRYHGTQRGRGQLQQKIVNEVPDGWIDNYANNIDPFCGEEHRLRIASS